jgi:hypothetical protein
VLHGVFWALTADGSPLDLGVFYLQTFATLMVSCYLLCDWSRLLYRMHRKQKERSDILKLNWSLRGWLARDGKRGVKSDDFERIEKKEDENGG